MLFIKIDFKIKLAGQQIPVSYVYTSKKKFYREAYEDLCKQRVVISYLNKNNVRCTYPHSIGVALKKAYHLNIHAWK